MRRIYAIVAAVLVLVLVLVVAGLLWCREARAQDLATRRKVAAERAAVSVRAVDKPAKKEEGVQPSLKQEVLSIELQTPDIMTYLLEHRGKIALYAGLNGTLRVELGLFGYLGFT